jgi:hypothetical protein
MELDTNRNNCLSAPSYLARLKGKDLDMHEYFYAEFY